MTIAPIGHVDGNRRRLEQLFEISQLFLSFNGIEQTLDAALHVMAETLPIESAIVIEAVAGGHNDMVVWGSVGGDTDQLQSAKAHAHGAYAYMIGAPSSNALALREEVGLTTLRAPIRELLPASKVGRFIVLPLVVGHRAVFGALQLEGAARLDREDLQFVNTIVNLLAVALERSRAWDVDVVRRREAELAEAKYEMLVDNLDRAFLWEADLDTRRVLYVSAQFELILGIPRHECLKANEWWSAHVHPDDRDQLALAFARVAVEPGNQRCEHRCLTPDGSVRWLHTSMHLVEDGDLPRLQGVSYDITATRAAQEDNARLYEQARHAVTVREQTLAIVSHDLRGPLSAIVLAATVLRDDTAPVASNTHALNAIENAASRMDRMIGDLLDVASIDAGKLAIVVDPEDVGEILHESTSNVEAIAKKRGVRLTRTSGSGIPALPCDRARILQVIENLLGNAIKIAKRGDAVALHAELADGHVVFSVADTGPGIGAADQQHLFERYWRSTEAPYKGTGLGLAIAKGIVEAHRGRIWMESELGRGATFYFTVPLV